MKYQISILFICICALFSSCKKEQQLVFSETYFTSENDSIVSVNLLKANGNSKITSHINSELENYVISVLQIGEPIAIKDVTIDEQIDAFIGEFVTFKNDFPESNQQWEAQIDSEIMYQSVDIISIALTSYIDTGGAHGNLSISFMNFSPQTGKLIPNSELFNNIDEVKTLAQLQFENEIQNSDDLSASTEKFDLPVNIGYTDEGVIFLYNVYEIAPYARGILEFSIPFETISDHLIYK